ncbi:MAG TPA: DNA polymerase III subunit alpha [Desulfobulbaceae bacterium]|nr:DNA polymerase III subunit alpha [Desulfobulbaceae bacterium]
MIPLGLHSHYSLLRSPTSCDALCRQARQLGYRTIGLTDINNLYGLWDFVNGCDRYAIRPIIGAELRSNGERAFFLVKSSQGYTNLCRIITGIHQDNTPLHSLPEKRLQGLVLLSDHKKLLTRWQEMELDIGAAIIGRPDQQGSELRNHARLLNIPAMIVADTYILTRNEKRTLQILRAIAGNCSLSRLPADQQMNTGKQLLSPGEYEQRYRIWPELLRNTRAIAERCEFHGPKFGLVPPPYKNLGNQDADHLLRRAALAGARQRYGSPLPKKVMKRLNHELQIIASMGFSSYFLVVRDIVRPVSRTCGRGSGAASLVAYCLAITNVCPIRHNLYFERFLNPGRTDAPDIDIDFAWDERDQVLASVFSTYKNHCAMVSNMVTMQPRKAIRETARVFGLPAAEINTITRRLSGFRFQRDTGDDLHAQLRATARLRNCSFAPPWPEILARAQELIDIPATLSVHPGGIIITPRPITDYVPVQQAAKGVPIIQWDKDGAEQAGLVKIDLLGNRSLGVIRDALIQVRATGVHIDEHSWRPEEDAKTRQLVKKGLTMGCFYIESPAMRILQKKAGRGDFEHLVIHSSIIRPAANDCIRTYLRRLHGEKWQPLHPLIADILSETYGIMVYQEDVSRVAVQLGFSPAQGDRLRKIMSKKDKDGQLADFRDRFFQAAAEKKLSQKEAEGIWQMMLSFAGYSFCKPHSASYARVSFQAAWLKAHYPAEFMAAVISNQGGFYSTFAYVSEARRMGLRILPPDVNRSEIAWRGHGRELQVGLMAIAGLSETTRNRILQERNMEGDVKKFASLLDFLQRVHPADDEARALIHAGALDGLVEKPANRSQMLYQLAQWQQSRSLAINRLFPPSAVPPPALPGQHQVERLRNEYRVLGFLCHTHPICLFDQQRQRLGTILARDLDKFAGSREKIPFLGWPITAKIVGTKTGQPMEFLTFEDETGQVECTLFPRTYQRHCHLLHTGAPLLLTGTVEQDFGALSFTVTHIAPVPVTGKRHKEKPDYHQSSETRDTIA